MFLRANKKLYQPISGLLQELIKLLDVKQNSPNGFLGTPSGFSSIDNITSGWFPSQLIVVAGRPGMGKTSFASSVLLKTAMNFNTQTAFFALSISQEVLLTRLLSSKAKIKSEVLTSEKLKDDQWETLRQSADEIANSPIYISDVTYRSFRQLSRTIKRLKRHHGINLFIIDDLAVLLQSVKSSQPKRTNYALEELKRIAKKLNVTIILLLELNQSVEIRGGDRRPQLSDIGEAEQYADMVLFLYRPEFYGIDTDDEGYPMQGLCEVSILKNKNGRTGNAMFIFEKNYYSFIQK